MMSSMETDISSWFSLRGHRMKAKKGERARRIWKIHILFLSPGDTTQ